MVIDLRLSPIKSEKEYLELIKKNLIKPLTKDEFEEYLKFR